MKKRLPQWSEEERQFAALLQTEPAQWTAQCYEPMKFVELARQGNDYADAGAMFAHMAGCAYCTQMYVDTARACQAADATNSPTRDKLRMPAWPEHLLAWPRAPRSRLRLQVGGATLMGAAAMLLLLLPDLRHKTELSHKLLTSQETARQLQKQSTQASQLAQTTQAESRAEKSRELVGVKQALQLARAEISHPEATHTTPAGS